VPVGGAAPGGPAGARILVSILNWNGLADTLACLACLDPVACRGQGVACVVLDNGSTQDEASALRAAHPAVEVLRGETNLGFAGGQNQLLRLGLERGFDSVLVLNNDAQIGLADILRLQACLDDDPGLAGVAPCMYSDAAFSHSVVFDAWIDWRDLSSVRPAQPGRTMPANALPLLLGTAPLLRCEALRRVGLFDERYFAYFEDNDLSARLAAAGLRVRYCEDARFVHRHRLLPALSAGALYLFARNAWMFWREHTPAAWRRGLRRRLLGRELLQLAELMSHGAGPERVQAFVDGCWDGWRGRSGAPPARPRSPAWWRGLARLAPYRLGKWLS